MIVVKAEILIRPLVDNMSDYQLMAKWRSDERVLYFYGGRDYPYDLEQVIKIYQPRVRGKEAFIPCMFAYNRVTIGYLQYYHLPDLPENVRQQYCLETLDHVYGIDMFIGEPDYWNRGIGTKVLSSAIEYIFAHLSAAAIVIDPDVKNLRAIRCYEKCGFTKIRLLPSYEVHEGKYQDCWLMAIERNKS